MVVRQTADAIGFVVVVDWPGRIGGILVIVLGVRAVAGGVEGLLPHVPRWNARAMRRIPGVLVLALALASCQRATHDAPVTPAAAPEPTPEQELETQTFVSTSRNEAPPPRPGDGETDAPLAVEGFVVLTPEAAKEHAQAAVAERLDPKKSWKLSPVLPAAWPSKEPAVVVLFYPMAAYQSSMTRYTLFTPAYRVKVSLVDGATEVVALAKPRALGTIEDARPSSLERRELEVSENALIRRLVGADAGADENPFWGYLKFIHEHDKLGRDLEKRSAAFIGWVRKKAGK